MIGQRNEAVLKQCTHCKEIKDNVVMVELHNEKDMFASFLGPKKKAICMDCIRGHNKNKTFLNPN